MEREETEKLVSRMRQAFAKRGVTLEDSVIRHVLADENCGSCWNIGCKDGCSEGCLSACKSGTK